MVSEPESGWSSWFSSSFNLCDGGKNCTDFSTQHSAWHIISMGWVVATLTVAVTVCNSEMSSRTLRGFPETMARRVLTADVFLPSPSLISESKHSSGGGLQMILQPGQALLWWPLSQLFASLRREASGNRKRYTHTHTRTHTALKTSVWVVYQVSQNTYSRGSVVGPWNEEDVHDLPEIMC